MNDSDARAGVVEIVFVILRRHSGFTIVNDGANASGAEPGPDKLRTVWQNDEYAVFNLDSEFTQRIAGAIRHSRGLAIR